MSISALLRDLGCLRVEKLSTQDLELLSRAAIQSLQLDLGRTV